MVRGWHAHMDVHAYMHTVQTAGFPAGDVGRGGGRDAGFQREAYGNRKKSLSAQGKLGERHFTSP